MRGLFVLVVEDDPDCAAVLSEALSLDGYEVAVVATASEAMRVVARRRPDVAIVDGHLGGDAGLDLVRVLRRGSLGDAPVLLATGMGLDEVGDEARAAGVDRVLVKPIELGVLLAAVAGLGRACRQAELA